MFTIKDIGSSQLKNHFNIFGFVKVSGFFSEDLPWINQEFMTIMKEKFGSTASRKRNYFLPQFIENNEKMTNIIAMEKIQILVNNILGNDPIFWGSDGNVFSKSTPWHRDYLNTVKSLKILVYLEKLNGENGTLRIIPGTHFVTDKYSSYLGDALTWPEPPVEGGFNEKNFFGKHYNPTKCGQNQSLPHTIIPTNPGDIIIFNHNAIHCTNASGEKSSIAGKVVRKIFRPKQRRMFGLHFFSNPSNIQDQNLANTCMGKMEAFSLQEIQAFKLQNRYGSAVMNSQSQVIQKMISPLKHVSSNVSGTFDGKYTQISDDIINHINENKVNKYPQQYYTNT